MDTSPSKKRTFTHVEEETNEPSKRVSVSNQDENEQNENSGTEEIDESTSEEDNTQVVSEVKIGPLSIRDIVTFKWNVMKFELNRKTATLSSKDMSIDLKKITEIKKTKGLWPGFEVLHSTNQSTVFHCESNEESDEWFTLLLIAKKLAQQ